MTAGLREKPGWAQPGPGPLRRVVAHWRPVVGVLTVLALAGTLTVVVRSLSAPCTTSPVADRAVSDLDVFVRWLDDNDARGYIGEVGWPSGRDSTAWNKVAAAWFDRADDADLWVSVWAAGRWWGASYPMAVYRLSGRSGVPPTAGPQAEVAAAHFRASTSPRGVALPSGSFGAGRDGRPWYSNTRPGLLGRDYYYENAADYESLARSGVQFVRLSLAWERVQPTPGGPLDEREIRRIESSVADAHAAGLAVVLDVHNYADYYVSSGSGRHRRLVLGSPELPTSSLADLWARLARAFRSTPGVLGYGLMNEPTDLAPTVPEGVQVWEDASQRAVDAIRQQGDSHTVLVSGYGGSSPGRWPDLQPRPWIVDPDHAIRYEAHQYFDGTRSGAYSSSYTAETAAAEQSGYGRQACSNPRAVSTPGGASASLSTERRRR